MMMKSEGQLKTFYDTVLASELAGLEEQRKKIVAKLSLVSVGIIAGFLILIILYQASPDKGDPRFYFFSFFGAAAIWTVVLKLFTKNYVSDFKSKVIDKIVEFIDPNLQYQKDGHVGESEFISCEIFKRKPDRYKGDDRIIGTLGLTKLQFSEIHAEYVTRDSRGRATYHTIFKGLLFVADFNKNFSGKTVVLPDKAEKIFGQLGSMMQSWNKGRGQLIKLEDPQFEKLFVVYGDDQVQARYILSTSLMKRIVDFKKKSRKSVYLSFIGSKIFVAIAYSKDLFEPRIFKTLLNFEPIREYYQDLQLALGIVEDLNLNLRIWNK